MNKHTPLLTVTTLILFSFLAGFVVAEKTGAGKLQSYTPPQEAPADIDLRPVWRAWQLLEEKFTPASTTQSVTREDNVWGIIEGLAQSYKDPYTVFFPPDKSESFAEEISGEFGGVGIELGVRDGILTVIAPLKGTPAEAAGLQSGDRIVKVDGKTTQNITIDEAVNAIRGAVGTTVTLTIAREGENEFLEVPISRGTIEIPTIDTDLRDDDIFVISLYNFGGTATHEIRTALRTFKEIGADKLIIDLRGNPGGYLDVAVEMASWFLPIGETVVIEDYGTDEESFTYRSKGYDIMEENWNVVILIDEGSASASEIVAGALQEHGVATLIGETTFGKGSVQELVDVTENTSLKITVARWLTPNGNSLSETGLDPDFEIPLTHEDIEAGNDPQLDAAVEYLNTGTVTFEEKIETVDDTDKIE